MMESATPIISVRSVSKRFSRPQDLAAKIVRRLGLAPDREIVHAVDGVSLDIYEGEIFGLVGESGCGKSTLGRVIAGIHSASEGKVVYRGRKIEVVEPMDKAEIQMIFQDPQSSLNSRMRVRGIVAEGLVAQGMRSRTERKKIVEECMLNVGLDPSYMNRFPHQFSGGQRQRISIARALAVRPKILICDESIAALDVSIQAQIINLFMELKQKFKLTYLFISHDISVVQHIANRVAVMYLGRILEIIQAEDLFDKPNHPYTQALLSAIPKVEAKRRAFKSVEGEIPSPLDPPSGCHFHQRCPHAMEVCRQNIPKFEQIDPGHFSACHLNNAGIKR